MFEHYSTFFWLLKSTYQCQLLTLVASGRSSTIQRGSPSPHLAIARSSFTRCKRNPKRARVVCNRRKFDDKSLRRNVFTSEICVSSSNDRGQCAHWWAFLSSMSSTFLNPRRITYRSGAPKPIISSMNIRMERKFWVKNDYWRLAGSSKTYPCDLSSVKSRVEVVLVGETKWHWAEEE